MIIEKTETFVEHDIIVDGTKVGTVELCPERHEISRLIIFEPYQNKGYGTDVVKELITRGYKSLWVRSDNPRAIHVYEKCGFVRGKTQMFEMVAESEDATNLCNQYSNEQCVMQSGICRNNCDFFIDKGSEEIWEN